MLVPPTHVVTMDVSRITQVLVNLASTEEETLYALQELSETLHTTESTRIRQELFRTEVVKTIIGLLRCSCHPPTLKTAAHVISLISYGCAPARQRMASMGIVEILLHMLDPMLRRGLQPRIDPASLEWLSVCEEVMMALHKLSFKCEDIQSMLVRDGGVGKVVSMCNDKRVKKKWVKFPEEASSTMRKLVEGKFLIARGGRVCSEEKDELLEAFPVLSKLGGVKESYPAFMLDLVDKDGCWLADTMVQQGECILVHL